MKYYEMQVSHKKSPTDAPASTLNPPLTEELKTEPSPTSDTAVAAPACNCTHADASDKPAEAPKSTEGETKTADDKPKESSEDSNAARVDKFKKFELGDINEDIFGVECSECKVSSITSTG
jgi:hypothetical protein